jgi:predicted ATP-grasp superfamily ATP-dependent carboligase
LKRKDLKATIVCSVSGDLSSLKILVYEHVSSGGLSDHSISASLLCEGYGMLRSIASDFKSAGHEVRILFDSRIASLSSHFQAGEIIVVSSVGEVNTIIKKLDGIVDAAFVIAPEQGNVLHSIVERIETTNAFSLNCGSEAIEQVSNKAALLQRTSKLGLDFPKSLTFPSEEPMDKIIQSIRSNLGFPVVIKPLSGTGCSGLSITRTEIQVADAIKKVKNESFCSAVMVQEYVQGINASVSAICTDKDALPVSLNFQEIKLSDPVAASSYTGGQVPFEHPLKTVAFNATKRLLTSYKGLRGYVGVDFVLTKEKAFVMEVNPRLTTSYIGLRKVINFNLEQAIIDSALKQKIHGNLDNYGVAMFRKVPVCNQGIFRWRDICDMQNLVSPPFPVDKNSSSCALVESYGLSVNQAAVNLNEAKEQLDKILTSWEQPTW